ncbi:MAG: bifunctional DNA-formamidopyrimidine glycosylase/DNA-(apurinic or apyrimidinic site) lyase [Alphaproteobacteria bacterium]|nr:bifunctional DNA-formamidopyrimidine glycosylase/DNA-(apurinic or apyrimidinic site) lyase [Alphaproteobacteria bacterium]
MPELPEVETVRRGLQPVLEGRRIAKAVVRRKDLRVPFPDRFGARLTGRLVQRLRRRAKYILADLDDGETLIIHLGMSGRFTVYPPGSNEGAMLGEFHHETPEAAAGAGKHDHLLLETDEGARIIYNDHRRFGLMLLELTGSLDDHRLFCGIGPEPLDPPLDGKALAKLLSGKATPIKAALLDQRVVAGLGNIYVSEALSRAGISPKRLAGSISPPRVAKLAEAVTRVLTDAIAAGGSTLRDHQQPSGELGYFQHSFRVYDREGAPCPTRGCKGTIRRIVQSGRSTFYCPVCQH